MDRFQLLVSGYLDGELSDDQHDQLCQTLLSDDVCVDQFVLDSFIHSHLLDSISQRRNRSDLFAEAIASVYGASLAQDLSQQASGKNEITLYSRGKQAQHRRWFLAAAVIAMAMFFFWNQNSALQPLGQLTLVSKDCKWSAKVAGPNVGAFLVAGQKLLLEEGRALVTLESGTQIAMEGPALLRIDHSSQASLEYGRVMATVQGHAVGFVIQTPYAKFVDLGTQFTVDMQPENKRVDLYVFDGLVDMKPTGAEQEGEPLHISEGRSVRFDLQQNDITIIPYDEGRKISL